MSLDDVDDDSVFVLPDETIPAPPCSCQSIVLQLIERITQLESEMRRMMMDRIAQLETKLSQLQPATIHHVRVKKVLRRSW